MNFRRVKYFFTEKWYINKENFGLPPALVRASRTRPRGSCFFFACFFANYVLNNELKFGWQCCKLTVDNLDYLLRDATFSGTSYGTMDMSVLLNCLTVAELKNSVEDEVIKKSEKFAVSKIEVTKRPARQYIVGVMPKGVGSVDQFLLNKYLVYTQMILSKYVTILEEMLSRFEIDYVIEEEKEQHTNYACEKLMNLVAEGDSSMPYYWFSDQYILQKISAYQSQARRGFSKLPKAIITRLGNLSAFNLYDKTNSECICSGCSDEFIQKAIVDSPVYQRSLECRKKLEAMESFGMEISQEDRDAEELELFSYHFTVYASMSLSLPLRKNEQEPLRAPRGNLRWNRRKISSKTGRRRLRLKKI